jgi:hypothetical protein
MPGSRLSHMYSFSQTLVTILMGLSNNWRDLQFLKLNLPVKGRVPFQHSHLAINT